MQPACSIQDPCIHFFPGMGFRPAEWVVDRNQYGDKLMLIVADDSPLDGKYDPGFDPYQAMPQDLEQLYTTPPGTVPGGGIVPPSGLPPRISLTDWPGFGSPGVHWPGQSSSNHSTGGGPGTHVPPDTPELPTPVPLTGSGLFLVMAMIALLIRSGLRRRMT